MTQSVDASGRLNPEEQERYQRSIQLPEIGIAGQILLQRARVLVVGLGGLGSPCAFYLAAAGVGTLGICDGDPVELSNLQRQILHLTSDIGHLKTQSAFTKLSSLNPTITVRAHSYPVKPDNAIRIIEPYDVIVDCTDSFAAKYLLNDASVLAEKLHVHAGVRGVKGQVLGIVPRKTACLRCILPASPAAWNREATDQWGIMGPVAGIVGSLQALEVTRMITDPVYSGGELTICEPYSGMVRRVAVSRSACCPLCGNNPVITVIQEDSYS